MMRCDDELVQLYVDGALHPAEAAVVEAHLQGCAACRRRASFYKGLFWDLAHYERLVPQPEVEPEGLADLLRAEHRRHQRPAPEQAAAWAYTTLWLTANPAIARPARAVSEFGQATAGGLLRAGRRTLRRLLRLKGGG